MKRNVATPVPPRLSMEAYADFVSENWKNGSREQMTRQKEIEERIDNPFCIPSCQQGSETAAPLAMQDEAYPAMRKSHSAAQSFAQELKRLRAMSVEERIREALGMAERFSWLAPVNKEK